MKRGSYKKRGRQEKQNLTELKRNIQNYNET